MKLRTELPLVQRATQNAARTALVAPEGNFSYCEFLQASARVAAGLLAGAADLAERRVAFLVPPGFHYAAVQWGIWRAGGIAVPLAVSHPPPELDYVIADSAADIVVTHPDFTARVRPLAAARKLRLMLTTEIPTSGATVLPALDAGRRAMILYTSGTTSKPKGVVTTHRNIQAQVESLVAAWEWSREDRILCFLPLHHIHGVINILTCALWSGATCECLPGFDAAAVCARVLKRDVTLFMAVPTVYARLIAAWEAAAPEQQRALSEAWANMRCMVSGSAALPVRVLERWQAISGHILLERYGMTEIGMALSNPLRGRRVPGRVGQPLPGVEVRLVDDNQRPVAPGTPGEIQVRGPNVFLEYWQRPEATQAAFRDGWFCTGDMAVIEDGHYRILGRQSVDIIKTGGYKVSAIEIEEVLREHPDIAECAVVGVDDSEWGEQVCAALVLKKGRTLTLAALRQWGREQLAVYKLPARVVEMAELPRNAMGKVVKPEVRHLFSG